LKVLSPRSLWMIRRREVFETLSLFDRLFIERCEFFFIRRRTLSRRAGVRTERRRPVLFRSLIPPVSCSLLMV
jgi:hypothetical protein